MNRQHSASLVLDIQHFCTHDGPGIRTTVFIKGCPLHCSWCHNPEAQGFDAQLGVHRQLCTGCGACSQACPQGVHSLQNGTHLLDRGKCSLCGACVRSCAAQALCIYGKRLSVTQVMQELVADVPYYNHSGGGVTLSGGEPLCHVGFVLPLLQQLKQRNISTGVETCGNVTADTIQCVAQYTDLFLYDWKATEPEIYKHYIGGDPRLMYNNLMLMGVLGKRVWLRCPLVAGINDSDLHLKEICKIAQMEFVERVEVMPYHTLGKQKAEAIGGEYALKQQAASDEQKKWWQERLQKLGCRKLVIA